MTTPVKEPTTAAKSTKNNSAALADTIYGAFLSYLCSFGYDQPALFKERPDLGEAYKVLKSVRKTVTSSAPVGESTTKSTRERLMRHTRLPNVDPMGGKRESYNTMRGRTTPKKSGNNDPHRGGNPLLHNEKFKVSEEMRKTLALLAQLPKDETKLESIISKFEHKPTLHKLVSHMIACGLGGWRKEDGQFVNESDQRASAKNWTLTEDGRLAPKGRAPVSYNTDWLLEVRKLCEE